MNLFFRKDYSEKKHNLKERLTDFRAEIENLKREDRQTEHDRIHQFNIKSGFDKYSTLRKVLKFIIIVKA